MREARATHIGSNAYLTLTRIWQRIFRSSENTEKAGAPETIRTSDLCLRRARLYPAELRAPMGLNRPNGRQRQRPTALQKGPVSVIKLASGEMALSVRPRIS